MTSSQQHKAVPLTCSGHTRPVVHLEYSDLQPDNTYTLLSSCKDGNPMLRDWLGDWVGTFLGHKGAVWSARLSGGDASYAVTGSADFSAKVWDTFSGQCLHTFPHNHIVRAVAMNAQGTSILTGGFEKKLRLFDLGRPEAEARVLAGGPGAEKGLAHEGNIRSVVWSRGNENTLVSVGEDKVVRWWDKRSLSVTHERAFAEPVLFMERADTVLGELLTIASGKDVYFINLYDHSIVKQHSLKITPTSVALHPGNADRFIAGETSAGWVRIFDFESGEELQSWAIKDA